ncbi:hypothetical protein BDK51DRAFT_25903 [Blyttiomyces helicus]|uniref:Uncharacterized protein n=1 Tax=Blyttiomyces helicus TaxID=388810 RepID=A0A4V1ISP0_9FUNG|nr:hypothetical protein BDK51DRAFT_25903 [Blyttiomyces helicus]|eukprot:RKO94227.1 hypothetical protein BDK51DRAFT_25903 [Blyttiomyces helicus]
MGEPVPDTLEALISSCAPPLLNPQDASGDTILHLGARAHDHRLVDLLLACPGIASAVRNANGETPLHTALRDATASSTASILRILKSLAVLHAPLSALDATLATPLSIALVQDAVRAATVAELGGGDLSALSSTLEGATGFDIFEAWVHEAGRGELVVGMLRGLGARHGQEVAAPVLQSDGSPPANTPYAVDSFSANEPDPASFANDSSHPLKVEMEEVLYVKQEDDDEGGDVDDDNHPMDLVYADKNMQTRSTEVASGDHGFQGPSHSAESGSSAAKSLFSLSELSLPSTSFSHPNLAPPTSSRTQAESTAPATPDNRTRSSTATSRAPQTASPAKDDRYRVQIFEPLRDGPMRHPPRPDASADDFSPAKRKRQNGERTSIASVRSAFNLGRWMEKGGLVTAGFFGVSSGEQIFGQSH